MYIGYCVLVFYTVKPLGVEIDIAVIQNDETNITVSKLITYLKVTIFCGY